MSLPSIERVFTKDKGNIDCDKTPINTNCKFIYNIPSKKSKNNKHYVMWHLNTCSVAYGDISLVTRVRFFEYLDEARRFYKKVTDNIISVNDSYVILVSKEGKILIPNHKSLINSSFDICRDSNGKCKKGNKVDFFSNDFGNLCSS